MNIVTRGIRNAFRNGIRTFSIVIILGLSMGLALSMVIARQAVNDKIASVKSNIGNTITVSPAGARGFEGGGDPLTTTQVDSIKSVGNVTAVTASLSDRLTSSNTNLQSAVEAGALGRRNANNSGVEFQAPPSAMGGDFSNAGSSTSTGTRSFTPPVQAKGVNDVSSASVYGGSTVSYTSGSAFDAAGNENVAVVGKSLAEKNSLSVGSTFTAYDTTITVVGIYDTGTTFANNTVIMPLATLQRLSNQANDITSATVTVDSIDSVDAAVAAIKTKLGSAADVTSDQEKAQNTVAPLENVKTIASYSLIGALAAGAVIILLTMVMIVRERRREIGVVKAIGSSNGKTMLQFTVESITLTTMGLVVGLAIAVFASAPITNALVTTSSSSATSTQTPGRGMMRNFGGQFGRSVETIKTSIGPEMFAYGIGASLLIAIVGSAVPAYFISRIRPSEVMRAE